MCFNSHRHLGSLWPSILLCTQCERSWFPIGSDFNGLLKPLSQQWLFIALAFEHQSFQTLFMFSVTVISQNSECLIFIIYEVHLSAINYINFRDHALGQIQFWDLEYKSVFRCFLSFLFVFCFTIHNFIISVYTAKEFFNFSFSFFFLRFYF